MIDTEKIEKLVKRYKRETGCYDECDECKISELCCVYDGGLEDLLKQIDYLEQWAKEHPVKTYKDVLLEKIPKAILDNGVPRVCKQPLFGGKCQPHYDCEKCWNEEYREE